MMFNMISLHIILSWPYINPAYAASCVLTIIALSLYTELTSNLPRVLDIFQVAGCCQVSRLFHTHICRIHKRRHQKYFSCVCVSICVMNRHHHLLLMNSLPRRRSMPTS